MRPVYGYIKVLEFIAYRQDEFIVTCGYGSRWRGLVKSLVDQYGSVGMEGAFALAVYICKVNIKALELVSGSDRNILCFFVKKM